MARRMLDSLGVVLLGGKRTTFFVRKTRRSRCAEHVRLSEGVEPVEFGRTRIANKINGQWDYGTIANLRFLTAPSQKVRYWVVHYDDGDTEEFSDQELVVKIIVHPFDIFYDLMKHLLKNFVIFFLVYFVIKKENISVLQAGNSMIPHAL